MNFKRIIDLAGQLKNVMFMIVTDERNAGIQITMLQILSARKIIIAPTSHGNSVVIR